MKKWLIRFSAVVMVVMCSMAMVLSVYAAELPEVAVPVTISLSGTLPDPAEEFTVVLKADKAAYPMPSGTVNGACSVTITGEDTKHFPAITYDRVGVYTYRVYQAAGINKNCTYDDTVYMLTVTVSNKTDYSGLEATAVLNPDSEGRKLPGAEFRNKYKVEPPSDSPKTGDKSALLLYAALIVVSLGMIVCLFLIRRRNKREE